MLAMKPAAEPAIPPQQLRPQDQRGKEGEAVAGLDARSPRLLGVVTARAEIIAAVAATMPVFEHHFLQDQTGPQMLEAGIKTAAQAVDRALPAVVVHEGGRLIVEIEQAQVNGAQACGGRMGVAQESADLGVAKIRLVAAFALPASLGKQRRTYRKGPSADRLRPRQAGSGR